MDRPEELRELAEKAAGYLGWHLETIYPEQELYWYANDNNGDPYDICKEGDFFSWPVVGLMIEHLQAKGLGWSMGSCADKEYSYGEFGGGKYVAQSKCLFEAITRAFVEACEIIERSETEGEGE